MIVVTTKNGTRFEIFRDEVTPVLEKGHVDFKNYVTMALRGLELWLDFNASMDYLFSEEQFAKDIKAEEWVESVELVYDDIDAIDQETGKPFVL